MRPTRFRWFVIFLLFAISIVNYIDRAAISYSIPKIERDLDLSAADAGGILGAFGLGYAITTLLGGIVVDRFGSRSVLAVAAVLWSLSIGATGLASGFAMLYAARILLGVSEGPNFPAVTGAVSRWLAPQERATALGNALVAVPLALAIGGPLVTQMLAWFDWRGTFFVLFGLSILWVPLWLFFYRDDPRQSRFVNPAELAHIGNPEGARQPMSHDGQSIKGRDAVRFLLTNRTLLANYWAYFVYGYFLFFFMTWAAELSRTSLWPQACRCWLVYGTAVAVGGRCLVGARARIRSYAAPDRATAHRPQLPHRRHAIHRRYRRDPGGSDAESRNRDRMHHHRGRGIHGRKCRVFRGQCRCRPQACGDRIRHHESRFCDLGISGSRRHRCGAQAAWIVCGCVLADGRSRLFVSYCCVSFSRS
jgi:MFS family permease